MALRSDSIALLADVNPHKKSTKKFGKSKSLKFNVNLCSEKENSSEIIPEPEPERVSFYQAYPEIYSISATGKKKEKQKAQRVCLYLWLSWAF
jgi:hypothetical protein